MSYFAIKYLAALPLGLIDDSNRIVKLKAERCGAAADEMRSVLLVPVITRALQQRSEQAGQSSETYYSKPAFH